MELLSLWRFQRAGTELYITLAGIGSYGLLTDFLYERALKKTSFTESLEKLIIMKLMHIEKYDYRLYSRNNVIETSNLNLSSCNLSDEDILERCLSHQIKVIQLYRNYLRKHETRENVRTTLIYQLVEMYKALNVLFFIDETLLNNI